MKATVESNQPILTTAPASDSVASPYLLDIITVTKDDYEGVAATLESCRQLRESIAVRQLVVDSSSQDVATRVQSLCAEGPAAVEYHWTEPRGISSALNTGLELAHGEWVWYLHGGDRGMANLPIGTFIGLLAKSRADAIIFDMLSANNRSRHPGLAKLWPPVRNWVPHPSTIVRRHVLASVGGFDVRHPTAMDHDLWFRLFRGDTLVDLVSFPIAIFAPGGASSRPGANADARRVMRRHAPHALSDWLHAGGRLVADYAWWYAGTCKDLLRAIGRFLDVRSHPQPLAVVPRPGTQKDQ